MISGSVLKSIKIALLALAFIFFSGCSSTADKAKPVDLGSSPALLGIRLAWTSNIGVVDFPVEVKVVGSNLVVANSNGDVVSFDAQSGAKVWSTNLGTQLSAGVGSDGRISAVVSRGNELIVLEVDREIWRQKLTTQVFTAPLVAGGRVFVLSADRSVSAFDAQSGRKIWGLQRPGESLVLRQSGVLLAVNDTLVAGLSGQLVGINPSNGVIRWESAIASSRGTNDIERLVDLVGRVSRDGDVVCARAFQSSVGCVNASNGGSLWSRSASGSVGVHGDAKFVYGVESDGKLIAWSRIDGQPVWVSERLRLRSLSAPLAIGRSIAVGDEAGTLLLMSREDGALLAHVKTDGSAIVSGPVLAAGTLVVVTRSGGVFGFKPE
jgi:outer membrane protein assembly factor BamB